MSLFNHGLLLLGSGGGDVCFFAVLTGDKLTSGCPLASSAL